MYKKKNYKDIKENRNDKDIKENRNDKDIKKSDIKNKNFNRYKNNDRKQYHNKKEFNLKDYMIQQNKIILQEIENEKKYKPSIEWSQSLKVINIKFY